MSREKEQQLIKDFGKLMQQKLDERSSKGRLGWRKQDLETLFSWLTEEVGELEEVLQFNPINPEEVMRECADIANVAMFIWDSPKKDE